MALWGDQRWSPRCQADRSTALGCHRNFAKESPGHWSSIRHPALQKGAMRLCQTSLLWVYLRLSGFQLPTASGKSWALIFWPKTTIHHGVGLPGKAPLMVAQNTPIALDYHFFGINLHFSVLSGIMKHHLANYKYLLSSDNPDKDEKHREWEIRALQWKVAHFVR